MTQSHSPVADHPFPAPGCGDPGRPGQDPLELPGTPWSVRIAGGPGSRPSLEVYAHGILLDVVVVTPLSPGVLRGACRASGPDGRPLSLAWGRVPADGSPVGVEFSTPGLRPRTGPARLVELGWWFWLALADGDFAGATASHAGGRERCRARRV